MTVDTALMGTMFMLVIFLIAMSDYTELRRPSRCRRAGGRPAHTVRRPPHRPHRPARLAVAGALVTVAGLVALAYLGPDPARRCCGGRARGRRARPPIPALHAAGMSVVPAAVKGVGSGLLNTARQLGFLLGVAILVAVFAPP